MLIMYIIMVIYLLLTFSNTITNLFGQIIPQQFATLVVCMNPFVAIVTNTPYRNAAMFWRRRKIEPVVAPVIQ